MSSGEMARCYRTDSRVAGVRVDDLPHSLRVRHVAHEDFSGSATLEYDEERRDHCLTKVEAIPGLREENDWGFSWFDPVSGEERGGLVAFPPHEWSSWDFKRRAWCRQPTSAMASPRLSEARAVWPAMGGPLPEGRVSTYLVLVLPLFAIVWSIIQMPHLVQTQIIQIRFKLVTLLL